MLNLEECCKRKLALTSDKILRVCLADNVRNDFRELDDFKIIGGIFTASLYNDAVANNISQSLFSAIVVKRHKTLRFSLRSAAIRVNR